MVRRRRDHRWRRAIKQSIRSVTRPWIAVGLYSLFLLGLYVIRHNYGPMDFVHLGTGYAFHQPGGTIGYDGQFYYQIAKDPFAAYQFMDNAPFRYQRVLYPLVVRALSLGQEPLIPYALLVVNWASIVLGVALLSDVLKRRGLSEWYSLAYGLYFGVSTGLAFDLAEPFAYLLVALGIWLSLRKRLLLAAVAMGLAGLARETTVLFPLAFAAYDLYRRDWRNAARMATVGIGPLVCWLVAIALIFGQTGLTFTPPLERIPFYGIYYHRAAPGLFPLEILLMAIPTAGALAFAIRDLARWRISPLLLAWGANAAMIALMSFHSYDEMISCGRVAAGCVLAGVAYGATSQQPIILRASLYHLLGAGIYVGAILLGLRSFIL